MATTTQQDPQAQVITTDGELIKRALTDDQQVALWSRALHHQATGLVEVVAARRQGDGTLKMRSRSAPERFPAAGDHRALVELARRYSQSGEEVFCTPLTRRERRSGRAGGIQPARVCWVDIDDPSALDALRGFGRRPHLVVYSGSGGAHAYWRLAGAIAPEQLEAVNRKLAHHLGGDGGSIDRARIMRLPGTTNHKVRRPCRLVFCDLARPPHQAVELVAGLSDPEPPAPPPSPAEVRRHLAYLEADQAAQLAPPAYFRLLAGVQVGERGGHVPCPLPDHQEAMASCMVYGDVDGGWWCYGCSRGGAIYDLASLLDGGPWGRSLRGEAFKEAERNVRDRLGLNQAAPCAARRSDRALQGRPGHVESVGGRRR